MYDVVLCDWWHYCAGLVGLFDGRASQTGALLMTFHGILQLLLYMVVLIALAKPLGAYMARVYEGQPIGLDRIFGPLERLIYRLCGVRTTEEMGWKTYTMAMLLLNL